MNCNEARLQIEDLLDGDLDDASRLELEQHLDRCVDCARHFDQAMTLEQWLGELEPDTVPARDFTDRVMAGIAAEGRPAPAAASSRRLAAELIGAGVILAAFVPALIGEPGTGLRWLWIAAGSAGEFLLAFASDLGSEIAELAGWLDRPLGRQPAGLSPVWMIAAALAATAAVATFNYVQARSQNRDRQS